MSSSIWVVTGVTLVVIASLLAGAMAWTPGPGISRREAFWMELSSTLAIVTIGLLLHVAWR